MRDKSQIVAVFDGIRAAFPSLNMTMTPNDPNVDVKMVAPRQNGLEFDVELSSQGDELHLNAGAFWLEWFPCDRPEVVADYLEAVHGLLSGRYRIVEHVRAGRAVKAQLQKPVEAGWQTVGKWSTFHIPIPWSKTFRVLQNRRPHNAGPDGAL